VHGIPKKDKILKEGDIVSLDLGLKHKGMFTDMAITVPVGEVAESSKKLMEATEKALHVGISAAVGGKTWVAIDIGAYIASLGYNVYHYTLELSEGYVGKRYDSVFSGIDIDKLVENREKVDECVSKIKGKIIIKEYPPKSASYETFKAHIRQVKMMQNIEPDFIIIDYIDYTKTPSRKDRNEELDDLYIGGKAFAKELGLPVLSPVQANRTGAKNKILEGDNLAGNYSKLMVADMVLSLARTRKDKVFGTGRFHWMKNRFGPDGLSYSARINTANGYIEIDSQPLDDEDTEMPSQLNKSGNSLDKDDKEYLRHKLFNEN
jgi:hypothetical protein